MKFRGIIRYCLFILLMFSVKLFAQETEEKKIKFDVSGFIKSDIYYDSRQNVDALEGLLHIYPKDIARDSLGKDINAKSSVGIVDISSRLRGKLTGPDVFGAKLTGMVEIDFTGITEGVSSSRVRLRHAHSALNWEKTEVIFGQDWHPMFVKEVYPSVMSLNTGIPFQPFNRSPMLLVSHKFGKLKVIGAAISQADYLSQGPDGKSAKYLKNTNIPNLHLQLQYATESFLFGVAADYKSLQPRLTTSSLLNDDVFVADEKINSYAWMGYFKYKSSKLELKAKAIYGQNLSESILPGGYGVSALDSLTGFEKYTPYNHLYTWANIIYGETTQIGLFGGYTKNYGANDPIIDGKRTYGMALNIDYIYRITPTITHKIKNFMLALEVEYTVAAYADASNNYGEIIDSHEVSNTRLMFSIFHFF